MGTDKQSCKVFVGGLSWETSSEKLRHYFENYGVVREAFVSYNRNNGRPRGFGFVVFESSDVADKVVSTKHTIDRREVEAKKAVPKDDTQQSSSPPSSEGSRTKKIFVGGLAPGVDERILREYFGQFGQVEDAVVMYDHENKRPRGFGFVSFAAEESVDRVFSKGVLQTILDKQIEIKAAVPRDQMPVAPPRGVGVNGQPFYHGLPRAPPYPAYTSSPMHQGFRGYGPSGAYNMQQGAGRPPAPAGRGRAGQFAAPGAGFGYGQQGQGRYGHGPFNTGPLGKLVGPAGGYADVYNAGLPSSAGMFGSNTQQLYNLAPFQQLNGGVPNAAGKLGFNTTAHLKALNALAGAFVAGQGAEGFDADPNSYAAQDATADYAATAEAVAANLGAAGMVGDSYTFQPRDFDVPQAGWSSN